MSCEEKKFTLDNTVATYILVRRPEVASGDDSRDNCEGMGAAHRAHPGFAGRKGIGRQWFVQLTME